MFYYISLAYSPKKKKKTYNNINLIYTVGDQRASKEAYGNCIF